MAVEGVIHNGITPSNRGFSNYPHSGASFKGGAKLINHSLLALHVLPTRSSKPSEE